MEGEEVVMFKKRTKRNIRQRRGEEEEGTKKEEVEDDVTEKVELFKELRKLREKQHGISVMALALGKKTQSEDEMTKSMTDPFRSGTGGMVDMTALQTGKYEVKDDAYETGIGAQFSAETNTRDEDAEMLKYIENKLQEYKKAKTTGDTDDLEEALNNHKFLSPEEAALLSVPEHLRKQSGSNRSEEMLSNQMLSGIPEVDLGIEVKIRNIEATEEAKIKILRDRMSKKDGPSLVPQNMAVNFVQHNRFNIEDPTGIGSGAKRPRKEKEPEKPKKVVVVGAEPEEVEAANEGKEKGEKATDDFHFEKFKKQFRRF